MKDLLTPRSGRNVQWRESAGLLLCLLVPALLGLAVQFDLLAGEGMRREARLAATPEEIRNLAATLRREEGACLTKAVAAQEDYEFYKSRSVPVKFPTPADMARRRHDYYMYKANEAAKLAASLEKKIAPAAMVGTGAATSGATMTENEKTLLQRIEQLEQQVHSSHP